MNLRYRTALFIIFLLLFRTINLSSQTSQDTLYLIPPYKNGIYFSLFGNGAWFSLNYDRLFYVDEKSYLSGELGVGFYIDFEDEFFISYPNKLKYGFNVSKRAFFEIGLLSFVATGNNKTFFKISPVVGIRVYSSDDDGTIFRILLSYPYYNDEINSLHAPMTLSLGKGF